MVVMKILMLGWELPPHNSGGLGVACLNMARALAGQGADIDFVVPYGLDVFPLPNSSTHFGSLGNPYIVADDGLAIGIYKVTVDGYLNDIIVFSNMTGDIERMIASENYLIFGYAGDELNRGTYVYDFKTNSIDFYMFFRRKYIFELFQSSVISVK